jgi:hypothetical protein
MGRDLHADGLGPPARGNQHGGLLGQALQALQASAAITSPQPPSSSRNTTMPPRRSSARARSTAAKAVAVRE